MCTYSLHIHGTLGTMLYNYVQRIKSNQLLRVISFMTQVEDPNMQNYTLRV